MGLMNRVKNKSLEDVKNKVYETAGQPPSGAEPYKNSQESILQEIKPHLDGLKNDPVFSKFISENWTRLEETPIYFCTKARYEEGIEKHEDGIVGSSRTPHLKIDKYDMIGFIDNFKLSELNSNPVYQYKDDDMYMLCAYDKWKNFSGHIIYIIKENIQKKEEDSDLKENKLLTYFTCYEISRVLLQSKDSSLEIMDDKDTANGDVCEVYTVFRRTAISSGLALYLCKKIYGDVNDIVKSLKEWSPLDFQIGCQYIDHEDVLAKDIEEWLKGSSDYFDVYKWFLNIKREW